MRLSLSVAAGSVGLVMVVAGLVVASTSTGADSELSTADADVPMVAASPPSYIPPPDGDPSPGPGGVLEAGGVLKVRVAEAAGGRTVFGNLASVRATGSGFATAYACLDGPPLDRRGSYAKADLNYNGAVLPATSNRLIATADANGDLCIYVSSATALVVDVNAVADPTITPIDNQRTDTREIELSSPPAVGAVTIYGDGAISCPDHRADDLSLPVGSIVYRPEDGGIRVAVTLTDAAPDVKYTVDLWTDQSCNGGLPFELGDEITTDGSGAGQVEFVFAGMDPGTYRVNVNLVTGDPHDDPRHREMGTAQFTELVVP